MHAMEAWWVKRYNSTQTRHYSEMTSQTYTPAALLPGQDSTIRIE
jgi:hypothetical protein